MPLDKDILGAALYSASVAYNNQDINQVGDIEQYRQNFWKAMAQVIIDHFKNNGVVTTSGVQPGAAIRTGTIT